MQCCSHDTRLRDFVRYNKFLNIRIWYSKFLPAFRVDLSDKGACLTQDAKEKSALFFEHGSEFFDMLFNTIRSEASASREIIWNPSVFKGLALDEKSCTVEVLVPFIKDPKSAGRIKGRVASLISERPYRYK